MNPRLFVSALAILAIALPAWSQSSPYPRTGFRAQLAPFAHNVQGTVTIVDADTLLVEHFYYDGGGISVYFYLGAVDTWPAYNAGLQIGPQLLGQVFTDASFLLDLPVGSTLDGFGAVSVWCVVAQFPFGNGPFLQAAPETYCSAKVNSQGCAPQISGSGRPSVTSASSFSIDASQMINNEIGLMIYGQAAASLPFAGGTLCVGAPLRRTGSQNSAGNVGASDCSGGFSFDFRSRIQSGLDPTLVAGASIFAQYWQRDTASPFGVGLSDGLSFHIAP